MDPYNEIFDDPSNLEEMDAVMQSLMGSVTSDTEKEPNDSPNEKTKPSPPPAKRARVEAEDTCPICFEDWTSDGDHRLVSLDCGHLFGDSCIRKWLNKRIRKTCPKCKTPARLSDIRPIFTTNVSYVDNTEVELLKYKLRNVEYRMRKVATHNAIHLNTISGLKHKIELLESGQLCPPSPLVPKYSFHVSYSRELCNGADSCALLAHLKEEEALCVSLIMSGSHGLRWLDCRTNQATDIISFSNDRITCLDYAEETGLLLTSSLDHTCKIIRNKEMAFAINTMSPIWSCCWDKQRANRFFVGTDMGHIMEYDMRQITTPMRINIESIDPSPVISMAATPWGLISCQTKVARAFYETTQSFKELLSLPVEPPYSGVAYDYASDQIVVSLKTSLTRTRSRHVIFNTKFFGEGLDRTAYFNVVQSLPGSIIQNNISKKTCQFSVGDDQLLAAVNEDNNNLLIYNTASGSLRIALESFPNIMGITSWVHSNNNYLATLTNTKVVIHKVCHHL